MPDSFDTKYGNCIPKHFQGKPADNHGFARSRNRDKWLRPDLRRGAHHCKRPVCPVVGTMLGRDGSSAHRWIPDRRQDQITTTDDADHEIYSAAFVPGEGHVSGFKGVEEKGSFCSLCAAFGSHCWHTLEAGNPIRVGIESICATSCVPQMTALSAVTRRCATKVACCKSRRIGIATVSSRLGFANTPTMT